MRNVLINSGLAVTVKTAMNIRTGYVSVHPKGRPE